MDPENESKTDFKIKIGVSACLLGDKVRFDGGHKRNRYITDFLSEYFSFVAYCPEMAIGLGTPREPIRLVDENGSIRALGIRDHTKDFTAQLTDYGKQISVSIDSLSAYIFKKNSPSCGMERVKVYRKDAAMPDKTGVGLFAAEIMRQNPLLPVEEEGRLNDDVIRENFVNRIYVYARWKAFIQAGISKAGLIDFHTCHKYLLLAHNQQAYRKLGQHLSCLKRPDLSDFANDYIHQVMGILTQQASRKTHVNVLQHLLGFLRTRLDAADRAEMLNAIHAYGNGDYPLIVPITLLQHHFRRNPHPFVNRQYYLYPHPRELMLRNAI